MPDLAATLTTQAEQDAEDANIDFLRGDLPDEDEEPSMERYEESRRRRRRAVDAMLRGPRYTPEQMREMDEREEREDRGVTGIPQGQEYNGWAPGASDEEEDDVRQLFPHTANDHGLRREDSQNLRERMRNRLRRDHLEAQLDERSNSRRAAQTHTDNVESHAGPPGRSEASTTAGQAPSPEASLRATALLQAVRRNSQFSAHSRMQLQRHILDRERGGNEVEARATATSTRPHLNTLSPSQRRRIDRVADALPENERQRMHADYQQQLALLDAQALQTVYQRGESYRGQESSRSDRRTPRYWATRTEAAPKNIGRSVDNVIQYLERLRLCETHHEGLLTAGEGGFEPEMRQRTDFLMDTTVIPTPPRSSWLEIGGVFSGTQNAVIPSRDAPASSPSTTLPSHAPLMPPSQYRSRVQHPTLGTTTARTTSPVRQESARPSANPNTANTGEASQQARQERHSWVESPNNERWPVKVTIHSINYDDMTLSGTMEAFNVPDKTSPTRESSITTFLEGEIIDFNKHTLETKSFRADARVDAVYWRKLPPFSHLKDDNTMIQNLLSQDWLKEELMEKWILMRWKGNVGPPLSLPFLSHPTAEPHTSLK